MAPSWITTSKTVLPGPVNPISSAARIRWPVEETGRNSVTPSTMPRMTAISRIGTSAGRREVDAAAGGLAALVEPSEPFVGDGGERRRVDSECFETGQLA